MNMSTFYENSREDKNNLSYWFPKIQNCGLLVPATQIFVLPEKVFAAMMWGFYEEPQPDGQEVLDEWFTNTVLANVAEHKPYFVKNGAFSDKFDFRTCLTNADAMRHSFLNINYGASCLEAGGASEFIVRSVIPYDPRVTPCIYNGLPLRTEVRVFYDFDKREVMYAANYWDYNYVRPHLKNMTDKIIFDHEKKKMAEKYEKLKPDIIKKVAAAMEGVGLSGQWSVDILVDPAGQYWLIDMALAEQSAYWKYNPKGEEIAQPPQFDPEAEKRQQAEQTKDSQLYERIESFKLA